MTRLTGFGTQVIIEGYHPSALLDSDRLKWRQTIFFYLEWCPRLVGILKTIYGEVQLKFSIVSSLFQYMNQAVSYFFYVHDFWDSL